MYYNIYFLRKSTRQIFIFSLKLQIKKFKNFANLEKTKCQKKVSRLEKANFFKEISFF